MKHLTEEIQENALSDVYYGMKGVFRGYGYDYFKYTNQVDNIANGMIKRTAGLDNQIIKLSKISQVVGQSKIPQNLKDELRNEINNMSTAFSQYQQSLQNLKTWSQKTIS